LKATELVVHPHFWNDVEKHAAYLEQEAGLGAEFVMMVREALQSVQNGPEHFALLKGLRRHVLLRRF